MLKKIIYTFWVLLLFGLILWGIISGNFNNFIQSVENRTFDIRQNISVSSGYKKPDKDIVIIAIDDASYEYIMDNYGEWPLRRDVYAKVIDYIESFFADNLSTHIDLRNLGIVVNELMISGVRDMSTYAKTDQEFVREIDIVFEFEELKEFVPERGQDLSVDITSLD